MPNGPYMRVTITVCYWHGTGDVTAKLISHTCTKRKGGVFNRHLPWYEGDLPSVRERDIELSNT